MLCNADGDRIIQVITNILDNALNMGKNGNIKIDIRKRKIRFIYQYIMMVPN